jgi:hypothetical protein
METKGHHSFQNIFDYNQNETKQNLDLVLKNVGSKMVSKENLEVQFATISTTNYSKPKL